MTEPSAHGTLQSSRCTQVRSFVIEPSHVTISADYMARIVIKQRFLYKSDGTDGNIVALKKCVFLFYFLFSISVVHSRPTPHKLGSPIAHVRAHLFNVGRGVGRVVDIALSWRFRQNIKRGRTARVASVLFRSRAALTLSSLWLRDLCKAHQAPRDAHALRSQRVMGAQRA